MFQVVSHQQTRRYARSNSNSFASRAKLADCHGRRQPTAWMPKLKACIDGYETLTKHMGERSAIWRVFCRVDFNSPERGMGKGVTKRSSMLDVHGESVPLGDDGGHQTTPFFEFMPAPEIWGWDHQSEPRSHQTRPVHIYNKLSQIPSNMFISYVLGRSSVGFRYEILARRTDAGTGHRSQFLVQ